jgi:uracil-DNA glycosylase
VTPPHEKEPPGKPPKEGPGAENFLPKRRSLPALREAAASCEGCDLYLSATQTVFGRGPQSARIVFVGEQPGDMEDREGLPFVGPAGRIFDEALEAAGMARDTVYVTNAVKHFNFEMRGKARLHKRPKVGHVRACLPWLRAELAVIRPRVLVLLGATAGQAIFGSTFRVGAASGKRLSSDLAELVVATIHPSAVLRARDAAARAEAFSRLVSDLRSVKSAVPEINNNRDEP